MAHHTRPDNFDDLSTFVGRHRCQLHSLTFEWFQHPPCTEEQADWIIHAYCRRGYEVKKALSPDYRHWIVSVRLPYSRRLPRPSRIYQQHIWGGICR